MGKENDLGPFLVGDFVFDYFVGAFPAHMVVVIFADNASVAVKNALSLVDWLGL